MAKKTVKDIDVSGKRVLVRVDFNVPLGDKGKITDDTRIRAVLPTIKYLVEKKAKVILMSHLGRPKDGPDDRLRLDPVAARLGELLGQPVAKVDDCVGEAPRLAVENLQGGDVLLLENLRFYAGERENDEEFTRQLAALGDLYVSDAFGTAHRAHASTVGVMRYLPGVAGFLLEKEVDMLSKVIASPERPYTAVIGGIKVSDKIGVLNSLIDKVDTLIIGGGMANTFLKAQGFDLGNSFLEPDKLEIAREIIKNAEDRKVKVLLPVDLVVAPAVKADVETRLVSLNGSAGVPAGWMALDIGPQTLDAFKAEILNSATVVWNGPMGVFEIDLFAKGTMGLAYTMAESTATTVVGGGDSASAVRKAGVADRITHVSTGGGASLRFLEGKSLPGLAVLKDK